MFPVLDLIVRTLKVTEFQSFTYCEAEAPVIRTSSEVDNQSTENEASNEGNCTKRSAPPTDEEETYP